MPNPRSLLITLPLLMMAGTTGLTGQIVSTGVFAGWGAPNLDRSTGVELSIESARMPLRAILAFERGGSGDTGVPCEPVIAQFCTEEALEHTTSMVTLGVGWSFGLSRSPHFRIGVGPELFITRIGGSTEGRSSGRELSTNTIVQGAGSALDLVWASAPDGSWSVRVRAGIRGRLSVLDVECADCYDPYGESFLTRELSVSVGYRIRD